RGRGSRPRPGRDRDRRPRRRPGRDRRRSVRVRLRWRCDVSDVVLIEVADGVATLTLNRPDRLNAWTPELQTRYFDLLSECGERDDVRAVVVTGAGRGFCAGADMQGLQALSGDGNGEVSGSPDSRPVIFPLSIRK